MPRWHRRGDFSLAAGATAPRASGTWSAPSSRRAAAAAFGRRPRARGAARRHDQIALGRLGGGRRGDEDCKDGPFFAAASGKRVTVFSASDALEPTALAPLGSTVTDLSFMRRPGEADADAELAATCYGGVSVWPASSKSGAEPAIHMPYKGALESLAVSPDGGDWVVAGCQDRTVRIWFRPDWEARNYEMGGYVTKVTACAFDASGEQMASNGGGMKGTVPMVWNFSGEGPAHTVPVGLFGHNEQVRLLAWAPDKCDLVRGKGGLGALAKPGTTRRCWCGMSTCGKRACPSVAFLRGRYAEGAHRGAGLDAQRLPGGGAREWPHRVLPATHPAGAKGIDTETDD